MADRTISSRFILMILVIMTITISGCNDPDNTHEDTVNPPEKVDAAPKDIASMVDANNMLAIDLYMDISSDDGNVFFSPYSIQSALAMTYEGAKGETAQEMQEVLNLPENDTARRTGSAGIYHLINDEKKEYQLSTANALWLQEGFLLDTDYTDTIHRYYGGKVTNLDFGGATEESRQTINSWVKDQTNEKIKDLIPQGLLGVDTRLVLTNAIYFKGTWVKEFDPKDTKDEVFTRSSGETVTAEMMRLTGDEVKFPFAETKDAQILELPYDGGDLSMILILPKKGGFEKVQDSLSIDAIESWKDSLSEKKVNVYLPKFKFETKYMMKENLVDLGMKRAFTNDADFTGMSNGENLFIEEVIHQAYVAVDEEGTEAAAATGIVMTKGPIVPIFRADRPFIFLIQQKKTGNILFMGRVDDPTV